MIYPRVDLLKQTLTDAFVSFIELDAYSHTVTTLTVGKLINDPDWLNDVRNRLELLNHTAQEWPTLKPDFLGGLLKQFIQYASCVSGVEDMMRLAVENERTQWVAVLNQVVMPQLNKGLRQAIECEDKIKALRKEFSAAHHRLDESIQAGWRSLGAQEAKSNELAQKMQELQDALISQQEKLTVGTLSKTSTLVTNHGKVIYKLVDIQTSNIDAATRGIMMGAAIANGISYVGLTLAVLTASYAVYENWARSERIYKLLRDISQLQVSLDQTAQALAATKNVLSLLYRLEREFLSIENKLPAITQLWREETNTVRQVIEALNAGADPDAHLYLSNYQLVAASWKKLEAYASHLAGLKIDRGQTVVIEPLSQNISLTAG